jgi:uncharacterized protein YehS (DUF1456 family)
MINNDTMRRIRFIFDLDDDKMIAIYKLGGRETDRKQISNWLKSDEDPQFEECPDVDTAVFLNGFIASKRGAREGVARDPEEKMTNNLIFKKIKIALEMKDEEILATLKVADFLMSKHELSALFRNPGHKHYRDCKDQFLRKFLMGLQLQLRPKD